MREMVLLLALGSDGEHQRFGCGAHRVSNTPHPRRPSQWPGQHHCFAGAGFILGGLLLAAKAGIPANHVPYKGGGPSNAAIAQGEAQWTLPPLSAAMPHVKTGRIRCLATGGDTRSSVTPELPTLSESGVAGFRYYGWNGTIVPRGSPRFIVERLNAVMGVALGLPEVRKIYFDLGEEPQHSTPQAFGKLIADDYRAMGELVKLAGVKAD